MKRIYILEDNPIECAIDKDRFKKAGYTVKESSCDKLFGVQQPYNVKMLEAYVTDVFDAARILREDPADCGVARMSFGHLMIDRERRSVYIGKKPVDLRVKEYDILLYLAEHPGQIIEKRELYRAVWAEEPIGAEPTVTEHIRRIRLKIETEGEPRRIETIRRRGYRFCA